MTHQHANLEDTVYFWFGSNDTSGSGNDGASALADIREAGAAAGAIPVLSPSPTLLTHANYPAGCYEVAVAATAANGFTGTFTYGVFCTLTVDSQNPTGFIGSFTLDPIIANVKEISDDAPAADNLTANTAYAHNAIWIDTVNGAAGTIDYVNGTVGNPVNSIADANTLATSLGISRFEVASNSSITFAAAQTNQIFNGDKWTLALGGQNVAGSVFIGAAISGVMAGTGVLQYFINCVMNATSLIKGTVLKRCLISGTQTVVEAGEFLFDQCASSVAGTGAPTFDFGAALNSSNLSVRHHSGGWQIENMGAGTGTYNSTFEGHGQIIWAASCSATSNASIRGHWKITDNAGGAVVETLDDITTDVAAIPTTAMRGTDSAALASVNTEARLAELDAANLPTDIANLNDLSAAQVNAEVDTALADINLDHLAGTSVAIPSIPTGTYVDQMMNDGAATFDRTTDSLQAIRDRGDTAWITGGGGGITDILNVTPLIPKSIDLANTATWRLALMLTNALDDLPSTAEITPGTISIDRKAIGGTSWSAVVTDAACSEINGLIYYDEVFDTGTGYAEGDSIRVTFKSQKITVAANDYEIIGATGRIFYTLIRETERGTDSAALASVATEARLAELDAANLPTDIAAIPTTAMRGTDGALTDKTGFALTSAEHTNIADALLKRDWNSVAGEAARSALNALRFLRNKWSISGSTLTVTEEDDTTTAWTANITDDAAADPVTGVDPT